MASVGWGAAAVGRAATAAGCGSNSGGGGKGTHFSAQHCQHPTASQPASWLVGWAGGAGTARHCHSTPNARPRARPSPPCTARCRQPSPASPHLVRGVVRMSAQFQNSSG
jgi:hypothetical protein